ncbi:hypothetical protein TWF718_004446 [Orbilia javanica]|uniref:Uncharacterized protein n=1 Tax=Orbilia javanica TaxID=47235 RepID=A0AAN8RFJ2_9PEZI
MHFSTLFHGFALALPLALCVAIPLEKRGHDVVANNHIEPLNHTKEVYPWPRIAVKPEKRHHGKNLEPAKEAPTKDLPNKTWSLPGVVKRDHSSQLDSTHSEVYDSKFDAQKRDPEPHPDPEIAEVYA